MTTFKFAERTRDTLLHGPDTSFRQIVDPSIPPGTIYFMPPIETILATMQVEGLTFEQYVTKYTDKFAVIKNVGDDDDPKDSEMADDGTDGTPTTDTGGVPASTTDQRPPRVL